MDEHDDDGDQCSGSRDDDDDGYHYGECWDCGAPDRVLDDEGYQCSDCRDDDDEQPPRP